MHSLSHVVEGNLSEQLLSDQYIQAIITNVGVKYAVINEPRQQVSRIQEEVIKFNLLSFENNSDLV